MEAETAISMIIKEFVEATAANKKFNSAHEGYAVILEELDELWEEVRKKATERISGNMTREAVQVGAMAMRFLVDLCEKEEGN